MFYAQIDGEGVCIGISNLKAPIDDPSYVVIPTYAQSYLRRKYEDGAWTNEYVPLEPYEAEFIDTNSEPIDQPDPEEPE